MKHFSLPTELLKMSVYNMVDIDGNGVSGNSVSSVTIEDKEILMPIEELERKFNVSSVTSATGVTGVKLSSSSSLTAPSVIPQTQPPVPVPAPQSKFSRPDVTWLRRTEYISSVKNNPNNVVTSVDDDAKAILSESAKFEDILREVEGTFENVKKGEHPIKCENVELVQSYPILFDETGSFVHCLIFGDKNSISPENSTAILNLRDDPIVTLFTAPSEHENLLKSAGEFDIQKNETAGKSFVVMLPAGDEKEKVAILSKIGSTFSLRKRRNSGKTVKKNSKVMKITRN